MPVSLGGGPDFKNPTYKDLMHNGKYCEYGLAFPVIDPTNPDNGYAGKCTQVDKVEFNDNQISSPYKCDPTDNEKFCNLHYNTTSWDGITLAESKSFASPCKCSLDGDTGFCSSILGTADFAKGAAAIKALFS